MNFESSDYKVALPDLPSTLPRDAGIPALNDIASRARRSVAAMRALHEDVRARLTSEARLLRPELDLVQWADDARHRLVAPLWACGVYGSEWDLSIGNYASLLMSIATLLPEFAEIAAQFHSLTEQLAALHDEAERLPELALADARQRRLLARQAFLRVVSRF